jgi:biopolymer transport protein ExbD
MKFPRNARITKGSLEAAPWVTVMFLLVLFIMLGGLLHTPGVRVQLPEAQDLPGTDRPTISVAMDAAGRLFYQSRLIEEAQLLRQLSNAVARLPEKPTLVVQADKGASYDHLIRLSQVARTAGIEDVLLATLPGPFRKAASPSAP